MPASPLEDAFQRPIPRSGPCGENTRLYKRTRTQTAQTNWQVLVNKQNIQATFVILGIAQFHSLNYNPLF